MCQTLEFCRIFAALKSTAYFHYNTILNAMFLLRDDISEIAAMLQRGNVICYPTDTIWGIGCNVFDEAAVARVSAIKGRTPDKGYVILVSDISMLKRYVPKILPRLETLLSHHTRPLTMIYPETVGLPDWVKAPDGSAAIRVATDEFCQELIAAFGKPIISTSANISGAPFPATFGGISSEILVAVDYVVKYRQDDKTPAEPSSIAILDRYQELEFIRE
jgi:L-threonylcarbamoyladenylate synthase